VKKRRRRRARALVDLREADASLLDLVDHLLTKGVVVSGDLVLGLAGVDLLYLHLSALLCASDRVVGPPRSKWRPM
jgi:hypothetical protein